MLPAHLHPLPAESRRILSSRRHAGAAVLLLALFLAALAGCRTDAQDQKFNFNNPLDPHIDTGGGNGANTGQIVIAQVNSDPDVVTIVNTGAEPTVMDNWTLENENNSAQYKFSGFTLLRDAYVNVHTGTGTDSSTEKYTNSTTPNWQSAFPNSQAILRNVSGDAIDTCASSEVCWQ
jgi:hypothetical protein